MPKEAITDQPNSSKEAPLSLDPQYGGRARRSKERYPRENIDVLSRVLAAGNASVQRVESYFCERV
jgi:hypothetical protein